MGYIRGDEGALHTAEGHAYRPRKEKLCRQHVGGIAEHLAEGEYWGELHWSKLNKKTNHGTYQDPRQPKVIGKAC